jgi:hypothetical protein
MLEPRRLYTSLSLPWDPKIQLISVHVYISITVCYVMLVKISFKYYLRHPINIWSCNRIASYSNFPIGNINCNETWDKHRPRLKSVTRTERSHGHPQRKVKCNGDTILSWRSWWVIFPLNETCFASNYKKLSYDLQPWKRFIKYNCKYSLNRLVRRSS